MVASFWIVLWFLPLLVYSGSSSYRHKTIWEVVKYKNDLDKLAHALEDLGLDDLLDDDHEELTLFAPRDRAWRRLGGDGDVYHCLKDDEDDLEEVLLFHVLRDKVLRRYHFDKGDRYRTVGGEKVEITDDHPLEVEHAEVAYSILAGNGAIHVLKDVMIPPDIDIEDYEDCDHDDSDDDDSDDDHCDDDDGYKCLKYLGDEDDLERCEGDCDSDSDCEGHLKCYDSGSSWHVPGCDGRRKTRDGHKVDYCYDEDDDCDDDDAHKCLKYVGDDDDLERCEGDCDSDSDCEGSLKCYDSSSSWHVPGCTGRRKTRDGSKVDYCYDDDDDDHYHWRWNDWW